MKLLLIRQTIKKRHDHAREPFMTSRWQSRFRILRSTLIVSILLSAVHAHALSIVAPEEPSILEEQAAKEIRRYIFLRTGETPALETADSYAGLPAGDVIVVAANATSTILPSRFAMPPCPVAKAVCSARKNGLCSITEKRGNSMTWRMTPNNTTTSSTNPNTLILWLASKRS